MQTVGSHELARRSLGDVHEFIDARISPDERAPDAALDESYLHQLREHRHPSGSEAEKNTKLQVQAEVSGEESSDETIYVRLLFCEIRYCRRTLTLTCRARQVEFEEGDPRNPAHFSYVRKWVITLTASFFSIISGTSSKKIRHDGQ